MIYVREGDYVLLRGIGLDDILAELEEVGSILVVDEEYADLYGEYVFLGYDVYVVIPSGRYCDIVSLYQAGLVQEKKPSILVCGEQPLNCKYAIAAHFALKGLEATEASSRAWSIVSRLYPGRTEPRSPLLDAALTAVSRLSRLLGVKGLGAVIGLADNYGYGWGLEHYNDAVAWTSTLGADDDTLLASALHFLTEGPGEPSYLLRERLEAVKPEFLRGLLGKHYDKVLGILESFAEKRLEGNAAILTLVEELEPGSGSVKLVEKRGDAIIVYCRDAGEGVPDRRCVERVGRAAELLKKAGLSVGDIRIEVLRQREA